MGGSRGALEEMGEMGRGVVGWRSGGMEYGIEGKKGDERGDDGGMGKLGRIECLGRDGRGRWGMVIKVL
jgi:hypothetical protein